MTQSNTSEVAHSCESCELATELAEERIETARLRNALTLCERALRDQPMQAFRRPDAQKRRAAAIDAARAALCQSDESGQSFFGFLIGISVIVGGLLSAMCVWVAVTMVGLPGWTALVLIGVTLYWAWRGLERLTRPANVAPDHITRAEILRQFREPRKNSLD